jgi:hypothetical protein
MSIDGAQIVGKHSPGRGASHVAWSDTALVRERLSPLMCRGQMGKGKGNLEGQCGRRKCRVRSNCRSMEA